ncbi:MAG TPA: hypothetical protein VI968_01500 [archaeon]|nr:hypothetical protein [archaeon]
MAFLTRAWETGKAYVSKRAKELGYELEREFSPRLKTSEIEFKHDMADIGSLGFHTVKENSLEEYEDIVRDYELKEKPRTDFSLSGEQQETSYLAFKKAAESKKGRRNSFDTNFAKYIGLDEEIAMAYREKSAKKVAQEYAEKGIKLSPSTVSNIARRLLKDADYKSIANRRQSKRRTTRPDDLVSEMISSGEVQAIETDVVSDTSLQPAETNEQVPAMAYYSGNNSASGLLKLAYESQLPGYVSAIASEKTPAAGFVKISMSSYLPKWAKGLYSSLYRTLMPNGNKWQPLTVEPLTDNQLEQLDSTLFADVAAADIKNDATPSNNGRSSLLTGNILDLAYRTLLPRSKDEIKDSSPLTRSILDLASDALRVKVEDNTKVDKITAELPPSNGSGSNGNDFRYLGDEYFGLSSHAQGNGHKPAKSLVIDENSLVAYTAPINGNGHKIETESQSVETHEGNGNGRTGFLAYLRSFIPQRTLTSARVHGYEPGTANIPVTAVTYDQGGSLLAPDDSVKDYEAEGKRRNQEVDLNGNL